jgi:hypothetical protein
MPHNLGDFPAHVELANPRWIVLIVNLVAVGCNVCLPRQIGCMQEQASRTSENEEQETSPLPAGGWLY